MGGRGKLHEAEKEPLERISEKRTGSDPGLGISGGSSYQSDWRKIELRKHWVEYTEDLDSLPQNNETKLCSSRA